MDRPQAEAEPRGDGTTRQLLDLLDRLGRQDLVGRATAAIARVRRPLTVVCVVGAFKQGKSSLVNGLLGLDACPVDDDLGTAALTLVRYADAPSAAVRRRVGGELRVENMAVADLVRWVSEQGNPGNQLGVERVDVVVPSEILEPGLVFADTPGMGGLGGGQAAATLSFLPFADGLLFVSDASAELTAPEITFLQRSTELCPTVLFVQTKIDLYPAWRTIFERNRVHLDGSAVQVPMVAASSALRREAMARRDPELDHESRFPDLITTLEDLVVTPAKQSAASRSAADLRSVSGLVRIGLLEEKRSLEDPSATQASLDELGEATERLERLKGPAARWSVLLADRMTDLASSVNHDFRRALLETSRSMDQQIEDLTKGDQWDEMVRDLQSAVAAAVSDGFRSVNVGCSTVRRDVLTLLNEEEIEMAAPWNGPRERDVAELWSGRPLDEQAGRAKDTLRSGMTGLRGAQGGVIMFGMMGTFLPTAAAALLASNPVLLSAGALFGGMHLLDDRRRKVTLRRQAARNQVRQFLDDVQFEVGDELSRLLREAQRDLRDEFTQRLDELQRTYAETAARARSDAQRSTEERQARLAEVGHAIGLLDAFDSAADGIVR